MTDKVKEHWKFEIFQVLLAKAPIMKIVDEMGIQDGLCTDEGKNEIKAVVRQLLAGTEAIYESLVELNAEKAK